MMISCPMILPAQHDPKAKSLLDQTAETYTRSAGITIHFSGSQQGTLLLHDKQFKLDCGGIISWFDGTTQWSYVADNQEVNVSTPTEDELRAINPYLLLTLYKQGFNYTYLGQKSLKGATVSGVKLVPTDPSTNLKCITLYINSQYQPVEITIEDVNDNYQHLEVTSYQTGQTFPDATFRFDPKAYPDAEIIDLR